MLSIGTLIWVSLRPLLRLAICVACGFVAAKTDIFPVVATRAAGQLMLNILVPCLMFSKVVSAFSSDNVVALGPLIFVAVVYEVLGVLLALTIKQLFWVPHRFRYGIVVAGGWGNYGDIPTAVIMSITGAAPFNGIQDQNLSVAYISAFILASIITVFPLGGHRLIAWDYAGPDIDNDEVKAAVRHRRKVLFSRWTHLPIQVRRRHSRRSGDREQCDSGATTALPMTDPSATSGRSPHGPKHMGMPGPIDPRDVLMLDRQNSFSPERTINADNLGQFPLGCSTPEAPTSNATSPVPTLARTETMTQVEYHQPGAATDSQGFSPAAPAAPLLSRIPRLRVYRYLRGFVVSLLSPPSLSIIVALIIALIKPLKALFVPIADSPIPNGPDGQPPLAFIMDTTTFIGAANVPLGLICLGSALARLNVPRSQWKSLPMGAIWSLAVGKIIVTPVLGILICQALTKVGVIDPADKVLRFVCIFFSCLPTATTQVYLTQVYSGTGSAEHISAFLLPQYALMAVAMIVLTAYSIHLIF